MTEDRYSSAAKCEELALESQGMPGLIEEATRLHERLAVLEEALKTKVSLARAESRTADIEVVAEEIQTNHGVHTAIIA